MSTPSPLVEGLTQEKITRSIVAFGFGVRFWPIPLGEPVTGGKHSP